jgi:regulator of protease activity HflC (stomatin/prohibitin superfamily)
VAALLGAAGAVAGGLMLANVVLLDAAITLGLSAGILAGVLVDRTARTKPPRLAEVTPPREGAAAEDGPKVLGPTDPPIRIWARFRRLGTVERVRFAVATLGVLATGTVFLTAQALAHPTPEVAAIAAGLCLATAGMAATAAHYFAEVEPALLPESPELCRGARVVGWIFVLAAVAMGAAWLWQPAILHISHFVVLTINLAVCYGLFAMKRPEEEVPGTFPLGLGVLSFLGSRAKSVAGTLDAAQEQLGIDLRSMCALTVVRHSLEPLVIGLCLVGWLSTSLTVVGLQEQGLIERLGVPVGGQPLRPGLHAHWPWPVDQVFRIPVRRVQALQVGHEGEEEGGAENVLWAREHAPNEYSLLLGNGRDLITIDAAVQFLIVDPRAWRYHSQNPADALRAIAYRAVMRSTVNRTLSDALSENVVKLTGSMRAMVQEDADALGLGVKVVGFTVGGMHPPVPVASDYEAVASAELGKVTAAAKLRRISIGPCPRPKRSSSWTPTALVQRAPKPSVARRGRPGAFAHWSHSTVPPQRSTCSVAVSSRSRAVWQDVVSRSWIPASSGMEASYGCFPEGAALATSRRRHAGAVRHRLSSNRGGREGRAGGAGHPFRTSSQRGHPTRSALEAALAHRPDGLARHAPACV